MAHVRIALFLSVVAAGAVCLALLIASSTSAAEPNGDVDCGGGTELVDAYLILQRHAEIIPEDHLACIDEGDVSGDGRVDSVDAALIMQIVAGLWPKTGPDDDGTPSGSTPTPTPLSHVITPTPCPLGGCPTRTPVPTSTPCPAEGCPTPTNTRLPPPPTPLSTATPCSPEGCPTSTPTPTPPDSVLGVEFSIGIDVDGDGFDDCSTRGSDSNTCVVNEGVPLRLNIRLDGLPANVPQYTGFDIVAHYSGVILMGEPDAHVWPDCGFEVIAPAIPGRLAFGCGIGIAEKGEPGTLPPSSYIGIIGTAQFTSACAEGFISLLHGLGNTALADEGLATHLEARDGDETLIVVCATP